jgi:sugar O-acyltransferase (sialic acid O-acetyltransferase NeuD family)
MKKSLIIFGAGKIAEAVSYFFNRDSEYDIKAYIVDDLYAKFDTFLEKPVIKLSLVEEKFPTTEYTVFVAVGYQGINQVRTAKFEYFKSAGYSFASYVSPKVEGDFTFGENTIIMDYAMIQPRVSFGNNVFVWGGAMIGHHTVISDHVWLTGGCLVGGVTHIGEGSFIGLGTMIGQEVTIGQKCMMGAATLTIKNVGDKVVIIAPPTETHRLNSDQFTRMSSCFRT